MAKRLSEITGEESVQLTLKLRKMLPAEFTARDLEDALDRLNIQIDSSHVFGAIFEEVKLRGW